MESAAKRMPDLVKDSPNPANSSVGFSLIECIIALLVLMIGSLAIVAVLNFAFRSNADAKKRYAAILVGQQRLEDLRNLPFQSLTAGTVTESNVLHDGVVYNVVRTIVDNDLVNDSSAPGPETKKITVSVRALNNPVISDTVTLVTYRMVTRPGPNRKPNIPT